MAGVEVIRRIRRTAGVPILGLVGHNQTADLVAALDAGADDCIAKPFSVDELHARLRALLHRAATAVEAARAEVRHLTACPGHGRRFGADGTNGAWPQRIR
jgi:DNA-binding response OmpR family regulator